MQANNLTLLKQSKIFSSWLKNEKLLTAENEHCQTIRNTQDLNLFVAIRAVEGINVSL